MPFAMQQLLPPLLEAGRYELAVSAALAAYDKEARLLSAACCLLCFRTALAAQDSCCQLPAASLHVVSLGVPRRASRACGDKQARE